MHRSIIATAALVLIAGVALQQTILREDPAPPAAAPPVAQQPSVGRALSRGPAREAARRAAEVEAVEMAAGRLATALLQHLVRSNVEMPLNSAIARRRGSPRESEGDIPIGGVIPTRAATP